MSERVSNSEARMRLRILENTLAKGGPQSEALRDLLAARERIAELEREVKLVRQAFAADAEYDRVADSDYTIDQINAAHAACNKTWNAARAAQEKG